ncbi:MAG: hypothetical protein DMG02_01270 [Acidobacteria bacterium]|nr:MAG: hypothetical protein DMG02_01270 [Acidobacteriota bacterium]
MSNTITLSRDRMQIGDGLRARALFETTQLPEIDDRALSGNARSTRKSSIFLPRTIGSMFMRVDSTCAHQVRPRLRPFRHQ